jgi:indolepyruvate ferredoxin oxidoreductase
VMRGLARGRVLRGTPFDPFGRTRVRRMERELVTDYLTLIECLVTDLAIIGVEQASLVASTAELVRGYEEVKMRGVQAYRRRRDELGYPLSLALVALLKA